MGVLSVCLCVQYLDQKRDLELLELVLQMVVSHHVGAGN